MGKNLGQDWARAANTVDRSAVTAWRIATWTTPISFLGLVLVALSLTYWLSRVPQLHDTSALAVSTLLTTMTGAIAGGMLGRSGRVTARGIGLSLSGAALAVLVIGGAYSVRIL